MIAPVPLFTAATGAICQTERNDINDSPLVWAKLETSMFKPDLFRRFAGGFAAGALAIIVVRPPEGILHLLEAVKAVIA